MYKCAIVGVSGNRAKGLADAYEHVKRGKVTTISTRTQENLDAFGDAYGVDARYTEYREMFEHEKPDLVHVNTPPNVRLEVFQAAEAASVPAVFVEKPLAIEGEDFRAIRAFAETSTVKIAINHQLHFHPRRQALQDLVMDGKIGEVRFIDVSCGMNLALQGTHAVQSIGAFHPNATPSEVVGQVSGAEGLADHPRKHFAPDQCTAAIQFSDDVRAQLVAGPFAPRVVDDGKVNTQKRIAVFGTQGYVLWTMLSWEVGIHGQVESGRHEYGEEDILGQAAATEAMFDWLEDDQALHPLNLGVALQEFNLILAIYTSALEHRSVALPVEPADGLIQALRDRLDS